MSQTHGYGAAGARLVLAAGLLGAALVSVACQAPVPRYRQVDETSALKLIAQRQRQIRTVQSTAAVELVAPDDGSVRLDAALAIRFPDHLRVRAWKLDRVVFDATWRDGELWIVPLDNPQLQARPGETDKAVQGIRQAITLLSGEFYETAVVDPEQTTDQELVVRGTVGGTSLIGTIDRATLTARRFESPVDTEVFSLHLDDYRMVNEIAWPARLTLQGADGRIIIRMRDVELNGALNPDAFAPPRRAVRQP